MGFAPQGRGFGDSVTWVGGGSLGLGTLGLVTAALSHRAASARAGDTGAQGSFCQCLGLVLQPHGVASARAQGA